MSTLPPTPPPSAPTPAPQKSNTLVWVLAIIGGVLILGFGSCAAIGFFAMHKMKQAGFNSDLMKTNPALATAKMAVAMSPDTEIVSSDDNAGTITVRDKKTGKVMTMKFDPQKKSMVIIDENGKTTSMTTSGEGNNSTLEMKSSEGTVKIGSTSDKAPDWVPNYPGSTPKNTMSAVTPQEQTGNFTFTTSDTVDKVISFYGDSLKSAGFAVSSMTTNSDGKAGGLVSGDDKANKRAVVVNIGSDSTGTTVSVTYNIKQ